MKNISQEKLRSFSIPITSKLEISNIYDTLEKLFGKIDFQIASNITQLRQVDAQRRNILKDAFSGRLVEQNSSDEPASVLLEKIRAERAERAKQSKPKRAKTKNRYKAHIMETLLEVLSIESDWIDAQAAFKACGVADDTDTDRIEELYAELRKLEKTGRLDVKRQGNYDLIKLKSE